MSFAVPQTPQRPLPGAYVATPAPSTNYQSGIVNQQNPRSGPLVSQQQYGSQGQSQAVSQQRQPAGQVAGRAPADELKPVERASRTIDQTLEQESRYPTLNDTISR